MRKTFPIQAFTRENHDDSEYVYIFVTIIALEMSHVKIYCSSL